jgi:hypothetical protein
MGVPDRVMNHRCTHGKKERCPVCMDYRPQTKYPDCQLLAAINARMVLTGTDVTEEEYERLVDLSGSREEGAQEVHGAYEALGVDFYDLPVCLDNLVENLPIELWIRRNPKSLHAILVSWCREVDVDENGKPIYEFRIVNYDVDFMSSFDLQWIISGDSRLRRLRHFRMADDKSDWSPEPFLKRKENIYFY